MVEGFAIAFQTFFLIAFVISDKEKQFTLTRRYYELIGIALTLLLFLINYWSFTSLWREKKKIERAELTESTFNRLTIMTSDQERPVNNCIVKFVETFAVIQKLAWILILASLIFQNMGDKTYVMALKACECYFLATFYVIGKLHQGNKKVN